MLTTDPDHSAEGLGLGDAHELLDPRNLSAAVELARRYEIDGVTADQCDYSRYAALFIGACLGFKDANLTAAQMTTNKRWMRERCREHQIFQPRFFACRTIEEVASAVEIIGLPVIVKPVDNRGSFGVHKVESEKELWPAFLDALMNAHSREVLVEAYIEGVHITVDGCVDQDGRHHNLAMASKTVTAGEKPIITEVFYPAKIDDGVRNHVFETNQKIMEILGINSGLTHSEYIVDQRGRCFLVETANRGGGVLTSSKIVPYISGVDTSALLISNALQVEFAVKPVPKNVTVVLVFFLFEPGQVINISGVDSAAAMPGVLHLRLLIKSGQTLVHPQSGAGRHGFAILAGSDELDVSRLYEKVSAAIRIDYA